MAATADLVGAALMAVAGLAFIGYGLIFFIRNFTDAFFELGVAHLHIAVSGFVAATGLATSALAWFGVRRCYLWALVAGVASPVLGLAVAVASRRIL
jgi:hypothetical protein